MKECNQESCHRVATGHRRCQYCKASAYTDYIKQGGTSSSYPTFAKYCRHLDGLPVSVLESFPTKKVVAKKKGKACKGNYRADHFKGCGETGKTLRYGLCVPSCFNKWLATGSDAAIKVISSTAKTAKKDVKKAYKEKKKKDKESIKTVSDWRNDLQIVVNWIVKVLDDKYPCISHPNMKRGLRWDAGHYWSVANSADLRFNMDNIHKQGSMANTNYGGCPDYLVGLESRHGKDYADMVQYNLKGVWEGVAREFMTIENIRTIYLPNARRVKREMQAGAELTREQVNELIGIYTPANLAVLEIYRNALK